MKFVLFYHSVLSCWNNGNAHFTRGIARALLRSGHDVTVFEPEDGWSRQNLEADHGAAALDAAAEAVADIPRQSYRAAAFDPDEAVDDADVVIVHEWTEPAIIARLSARRRQGGRFLLFYHDTHHRAVTAPEEIARLDLDGFDAVLAFGETLREIYERRGWGGRAITWHEAADVSVFRPDPDAQPQEDLVWIGNWGDDERSREIETFLLNPATALGLNTAIHGVRYPDAVRRTLARRGVDYRGWLPNHRAPAAFARARMTVHVPRRAYSSALPGIPTIRVFEALASGIPLISAPWSDCEGLFPPDSFARADTAESMLRQMRALRHDDDYRNTLITTGLAAIRDRHSCDHRAAELLATIAALRAGGASGEQSDRLERETAL